MSQPRMAGERRTFIRACRPAVLVGFNRMMRPFPTRFLCSLLLPTALMGCSVGGYGLVMARVTHGRGAWVMDVYAAGAQIRPAPDDLGISVGVGRRSYVVANQLATPPGSGWHAVITPRVRGDEVAVRAARTLGLELRLAPPEPGISIGAHGHTASRGPSADSDVFREIRYDPTAPELTCIRLRQEDPPC